MIEQELEARDYCTEKNSSWVPALARWDFVRANAKVPIRSAGLGALPLDAAE
jgi:type I restriction enzyme M protein